MQFEIDHNTSKFLRTISPAPTLYISCLQQCFKCLLPQPLFWFMSVPQLMLTAWLFHPPPASLLLSLISYHKGCEATFWSPLSQFATSSNMLHSHGVYLSGGLQLQIESVELYLLRSRYILLHHHCLIALLWLTYQKMFLHFILLYFRFSDDYWQENWQDGNHRHKLIWCNKKLTKEDRFWDPYQLDI